MIFIIIFFIFLIFLIGFIFLFGKSSIDGKWKKITFSVNCPKCGTQMPFIRNPTSAKQALWGGWTCSKCGCEMDKWGKEISANKENNSSPKHLEESKIEPIKPFDSRGKTPVERTFEDNDN